MPIFRGRAGATAAGTGGGSDGMNRTEAARIGGMDRQTLRDWVHRFNQHGPDGLIGIKPSGRPPKLSEDQKRRHSLATTELLCHPPDH